MFRDLSVRATFETALNSAAQLIREGSLWWRVSSNGIVGQLDEQAVEQHFAKDEEAQASFERILEQEITWALEVNLSGIEIRDALSMMREGPTPERVEETKERVARVAEMFVTPTFRQRWELRKTTKGLALDSVRWDINIKKHDLEVGRLADIPFAFLEFELSDGRSFSPFPGRGRFFFPYREPSQRFGFSCHPAELDALIRDLQVLKDNLERLGDKK